MSNDDIGFDAFGRPIAIGDEAGQEAVAIVEAPDAIPLLMAAYRPNGDLGVRVFGQPSEAVADMLDTLARDYRRALQNTRAGKN